jgi:hypothetical protein
LTAENDRSNDALVFEMVDKKVDHLTCGNAAFRFEAIKYARRSEILLCKKLVPTIK